MLTNTQIEWLRKLSKPESDVVLLIEVIDTMREKLQEIADDYPSDEKPERPNASEHYTLLSGAMAFQGDLIMWGIAKDIRAFLARLDAGMPEETSDNTGEIPF